MSQGISDLGTAIAALRQFHQRELLEFVAGGPPKLVCNGVLKLQEEERLREITANYSLTPGLSERLQNAFQTYTGSLNKTFARTFEHHFSPNMAVDPVSPDGILTYNRNGKRAFVGGGLVDGNEKMEEAAAREGAEESGGGCTFKVGSQPSLVVDSVRCKIPTTYFTTAVFRAQWEGVPVDNPEASGFEVVKPDKIDQTNWFMDHQWIANTMVQLASSPETAHSGIPYTSCMPLNKTSYFASKPFLPPMTKTDDISYVEGLIKRVEDFYLGLIKKVEAEVLDRIDGPALSRSRNVIGHGWEDKGSPIERSEEERKIHREWNDAKELWNYMGHLKTAGIKISELFGTFINVGEGGVIETVSAYANGDNVFLRDRAGKFVLEHEPFTQFRDFRTTIGHHADQMGITLSQDPILTGKYEPDSYKDAKGIRARAFQFIAPVLTPAAPAGTTALSFKEAADLPSSSWASIHDYQMFQNLAKFHLWTFDTQGPGQFALYEDKSMIGYAHIEYGPDHRAALQIIFVHEKDRKRGVGAHLLKCCEEALKKEGIKVLHTKAAPDVVDFYRKLGYSEMPFNDQDHGSSDAGDTAMGKEL